MNFTICISVDILSYLKKIPVAEAIGHAKIKIILCLYECLMDFRVMTTWRFLFWREIGGRKGGKTYFSFA